MILYFVMGFIIGIGLYTGIRTIQLVNKKMGIIQLLLTILTPISVLVWCLKKKDFVFGGTDWEFLIQTATIDKMIEPWLILILYIGVIAITIYNINQIIKTKKK